MRPRTTSRVSLTAMLGTPVTDAQGVVRGKLKDVAVATGAEAGRVAGLVLKTRHGLQIVPSNQVMETPAGTLELRSPSALSPLRGDENYLFLQQDLIDRQIIDIHGRKVVRVNDVDLEWLGHGSVPLPRFAARGIPWQFVDVIEVDPARRVKLKIDHDHLAEMHPSELAEILADLAPAEREAIFTTLDEEVAAEALEEVDPKLQKMLLKGMAEERNADMVEEMDPGAAADLLGELSDERSEAILEEMEPDERHEVEELLEFHEDSAAGRMTTEFVSVPVESTVADAVEALRVFDG